VFNINKFTEQYL